MRTTVSKMAFQNARMKRLAKDAYDATSLETVRSALARHNTLRLIRYSNGGASAVTPLDLFCLEAGLDGLLINMWDRDSIFQAIGELEAELDPKLGCGLKVEAGAWKRGLDASLIHHHRYQSRFLDIIADRKSGYDFGARPNIRYNAAGLFEVVDPWGHAQNDALGAINYLQFYGLNRGLLNWDECSKEAQFNSVPALMHHYFWKICVWVDWELGAWEDKNAEHASSIGVVLASLREQATFLNTHGKNLQYHADGRKFCVTEKGVRELIEHCETKLREILPNEFIRSDKNEVRRSDVAIVNAMFLSALSGRPLLDDNMTLTLISNLENDLMGHIGFSRYPGDIWDGRVNRPGVPSAQWSHVSPMISYIMGEMYQRTGKKEHFDAQVFHFNRTLAQVNDRWHLPEAYIVDPVSNDWVSDANESLAWAQAMAICAFAGMKKSLNKSH
ncbi:MAG: hypothetical protein K2W82_17865 [Candidatus Obscuribacterales bacterium]|nr:hypothetical protein [Candidatus Obscuribacterales bacterium]